MLTNKDKHLITVVGPTAIGKTALAIQIAKYFETEIISADSRQFYNEMSIGTAKPTAEELNSVRHHFINSHSIKNEFTVGDFEHAALKCLNKIYERHPTAVLVGGSGLFVKAITEGFDDLPKAPAEVRNELNNIYLQQGITKLQEKLKEADPDYYAMVDIQNPQRLIRALEVSLTTGKPFSSFRSSTKKTRPFRSIKIGLSLDRKTLYDQINSRVDQMMTAGLLEEVKKLVSARKYNALNTVGYSEIFDFLEGKRTLDEAVAMIKQNTRRFAKRQLTWFRKDQEVEWFTPDQFPDIVNYINSRIIKPGP